MPAPAVYAVVLPLVPLQVGEWIDRAAWPLHVTLVPNVATDAGYDVVLAVVREAAATLPALSGVVGEEAWFGPGHDVRVDLIESDVLPRAHEVLLGALEQRTGARPELPAHQRAGYRAHATVTASGRPQRGARLVFERIAVAEVGPDGRGDLAVPLAVFDLGTTAAPGPATLDAGAALRLYGALAAAGVRCTVVGGWGVDGLLGAATRAHHDLDVLVDVTELPALLAALPGLGMAIRYLWSENRWIGDGRLPSAFVADGPLGELDVHVVRMDGDRPVSLSDSAVTFPPGALAASGALAGSPVRCATRQAQLLMHEGYDLPPQHRADVERLLALG